MYIMARPDIKSQSRKRDVAAENQLSVKKYLFRAVKTKYVKHRTLFRLQAE